MSRPSPRLLVETPLTRGQSLLLSGKKAHYLNHVLRLGLGANVLIFNGRDGEWLAQIKKKNKKNCTLDLLQKTQKQTVAVNLVLAFAPLKKSALDFLIQKATELGIGTLQPLLTERTGSDHVNIKRLVAQASEASEQCGRLETPTILQPVSLEKFLNSWPNDRPLWTGDESGAGRNIVAAFNDWVVKAGLADGHGILIGPEGGFTPNELATLGSMPFVTLIDLGPRILRAETAALAALTCWQALLGDWCRTD